MAAPEHVCLPINLDAFVLNEAVCNSGGARIAPITQPNYVSLRLNNSQIQHDILPHVDLHNSRPAIANPRVSKTFSAKFQKLEPTNPSPDPSQLVSINRSRLGVYLHWTIPRAYRSGYSQAANPPRADSNSTPDQSTSTSKYPESTNPNPEFPRVPNRWLLVRIIRDFTPDPAKPNSKPDLVTAWVVESDKLRKIDELDASIDIETDVSPFVAYSNDTSNGDLLNNQAENYIGQKVELSKWTEPTLPGTDLKDRVPLTVMNSSNPLFADYAVHNPNVFSTKDNFQYGTDQNGNPLYLATATCDYVVVGWHSDIKWDPLGTVKDPDAPLDLRSRVEKLFCTAPVNSDGLDDKKTKDTVTSLGNKSGDITRLICHAARYSVVFNADKPDTPADKYAANFTDDVDMEPIAVGTSPLDAILAFFQAHQQDEDFENTVFGENDDKKTDEKKSSDKGSASKDVSSVAATGSGGTSGNTTTPSPATNGKKTKESTTVKTAKALMHIRELLYATENDYNSRIKAADLIFAHNFGRMPGGFTWHFDQKKYANEPPVVPTAAEAEALDRLNEYQWQFDAADRQLALIRWALFSEFFKYVSDPSNRDPDRLALYSSRVPNLRAEAVKLIVLQKDLHAKIDGKIKSVADLVEADIAAAAKAAADKTAAGADELAGRHLITRGPLAMSVLPPGVQPTGDKTTDDKPASTTPVTVPVRKIASDPFFRRTDPTLVLAGVDSGWDPEFLDKSAPTRFLHHITGPVDGKPSQIVSDMLTLIGNKLPKDLSATAKSLVNEASGGVQERLTQFGHKKWTGQPFSPQFVEWEGIYYHIEEKEWEVKLTKSALSASNHKQVTYINPDDLSALAGEHSPRNDTRHISGRMLVLPQSSFALEAVVAQVMGSTPKQDLPEDLRTTDQQQKFRDNVKKLKFISGQLSGLTDALVTTATGHHVKPNVRPQAEDPKPMQAAIDVGSHIGLKDASDFAIIGAETGRTPYGTLTDFTSVNRHAFKAVQQGQFAITKLTIVDKFGQAISCPAPTQTADLRTPRLREGQAPPMPKFIHPCLSEQLVPSLLGNNLNTVYTPKETDDHVTKTGYPMTPFIQLTPAINQEARINATFVEMISGPGKESWKPCSDWENPIFGWILVNYADSSLQFFTGDGIFYTALEIGGPTGTIETNKFQPFEPPETAESEDGKSLVSPQLDALIKQLTARGGKGKKYFQALWDLIRRATPTMPFPPSDYAQYANAIVGKPLALVNVGWSLELAQPPLWAQHTIGLDIGPVKLGEQDPLRKDAFDYLTQYPFKVKIGDAERPFDGVLAYWDTDVQDPFANIFTYFPDPNPKKQDGIRIEIVPENYPKLHPYFLDPSDFKEDTKFKQAYTDNLTIKTVLMDPYTPIHLYSGMLPIKNLQLPTWPLQKAMKNMTAFITLGPLLITKDVPKQWDKSHPLKPDTWLTMQKEATTTETVPPINLPIAGGKGMWNWLQPYSVPLADPPPLPPPPPLPDDDLTPADLIPVAPRPDPNLPGNETHYNALEIGHEDGRLRIDPAPYTFVEGFLQLARPLVKIPVPPAAT